MSASTVIGRPTTRLIGNAPSSTDGAMRSIGDARRLQRFGERAIVAPRAIRNRRCAGDNENFDLARTEQRIAFAVSIGRASLNDAPAAGGSGSSGGASSAARPVLMRTTRPRSADRTSGASARSSIETGSPAPVRLAHLAAASGVCHSHGQTIGCRDVFAKVEAALRCDPARNPQACHAAGPCGVARRTRSPWVRTSPSPVAAATRRACT